MEKEIWHGTNCQALPQLLTHGLQPPSDTSASDACSVSGGKGLCTTLCSASCPHCAAPHEWGRCHMYGYGIYLADMAQKSHRYVRAPERRTLRVETPQHEAVYEGVGANIVGLDGRVWGLCVSEEGQVWVLESGRIAKKHTRCVIGRVVAKLAQRLSVSGNLRVLAADTSS